MLLSFIFKSGLGLLLMHHISYFFLRFLLVIITGPSQIVRKFSSRFHKKKWKEKQRKK